MTPGEDRDVELDRMLDAMYQQHHYDFRAYARPWLHRRISQAQISLGTSTIRDLSERVLGEPEAFRELLRCLTIQVSDLFRDATYFRGLREEILPHLATYPSIRIWVAGCGTGEEAYSLAILLHEEGLLSRSFIYATDIDAPSLQIARRGRYDVGRARGFSDNYFRAGGRRSLSAHYTAGSSSVEFSPELRERILFSDHSLATDSPFAEMHLVSCRNVLIYFSRQLQDRAISLFLTSLCRRGFLGLGSNESIMFSVHKAAFEPVGAHERIYRVI